jgi:exodeoxyribonuclease VII large subunit
VSSPQAAGYGDFLNHLHQNNFNYGFTLQLIETAVQGSNAEVEICSALSRAQQYDADAIVLIRGGGSRLDLEVFNAYSIALAIAQSRLPVLTGIGHESDETVADIVAHTRLKTPTAVAHFCIEHNLQFESSIQWTFERIQKELRLSLRHHRSQLELVQQGMRSSSREKLLREKHDLMRNRVGVESALKDAVFRQKTRLDQRGVRLLQLSGAVVNRAQTINRVYQEQVDSRWRTRITQNKEKLQQANQLLVKEAGRILSVETKKLSETGAIIRMMNPEKLLKKGFALLYANGKIVAASHEFARGEALEIKTANQELGAEITHVKKKKNG